MNLDAGLVWSITSGFFASVTSFFLWVYNKMNSKILQLETKMGLIEKEQAVKTEESIHLNKELAQAMGKLEKIETSNSQILVAIARIEAGLNPK